MIHIKFVQSPKRAAIGPNFNENRGSKDRLPPLHAFTFFFENLHSEEPFGVAKSELQYMDFIVEVLTPDATPKTLRKAKSFPGLIISSSTLTLSSNGIAKPEPWIGMKRESDEKGRS